MVDDKQDLWHLIALRASSAPDPATDSWDLDVFRSTNEKASFSWTDQSEFSSFDFDCVYLARQLPLQVKCFNVKADFDKDLIHN